MSTIISTFRCPSDSGDPILPAGSAYGASTTLPGQKTNYDFITSQSEYLYCNLWRAQAVNAKRMFGQNSTCRIADITDGTSNTLALGEATFDVYNGRCSAWGYRAWVMTGIDPAAGINDWTYPIAGFVPRPGRLGSWGRSGSLHTNGANFCLADGSVRFIPQSTDRVLLTRLATMADGNVVNLP
jgi:prepilin-type processing-associated H-X9-DG protein